ncbi:NmrA-like [Macleaya cordata]|uniref:NmrA-like n=1 Tax=Macleaya cordata TaxID=56857 RepID=A0A200Q996_MACCD|nr:NmrA-like [Macleaya cordata]
MAIGTIRHDYGTSWHANGTVMARSGTLMTRLSMLMAQLGTVDGGTVASTITDTLMARLMARSMATDEWMDGSPDSPPTYHYYYRTGYIGKFIVEASVKSGNSTFLLVRESTVADPVKGKLIESFKNSGATLLYGDLYDHESLVKAIKQVDVVISAVGHGQIADQVKIISAIKEAGNVKRFFPSEFGNDVDRSRAVEPAKSAFEGKAKIRRAVEAAGIPYTYVSSNFFAGYFLPNLSQPGATAPPRDKVIILGDGNAKAVFNKEDDIGTYTIKAVNDPRTLNKILYIKPPANTLSFNDLVSLWEKKIGKTLEKVYLPEEQVLKNIQEAPLPINVVLSITHSVYVLGDQTYFEIEPSFGVEASELYPDVKYTTVDEYLDQFV